MSAPKKPEALKIKAMNDEERFGIVANHTQSWEYWIGPDSQLLFVSPSCKDYSGYSQEDFLENGELLLSLVHEKDRHLFAQHLAHDLESTTYEPFEFRIIDRNGKVRWLSHKCRPIYDNDGNFLGRRASNWEITDQKIAQEKFSELTDSLKKTSNLLNTVLNAIPDVIGVQDVDHRILRYNEAGYAFLNMEPEQVHGRKCHEIIGNKEPCRICATTEVYRTEKNAKVEKYVEELDKWLDVRAYPVFNDQGEISQVIEHIRDISNEKKVEMELRKAYERLFTVLNSIHAHVYVADLESYEVLFMNQQMIDDFKNDFVGHKCYRSFRNQLKPCETCRNAFLLDEYQNPTGIHTWQEKNPITNRWYIHNDRAIHWVDGRMVKIQIATDITEAKKNEKERMHITQQLQQAQRLEAIGTLAGGIAHDFNNLLMGIQGRVSLMSLETDRSDPQREHMDAIEAYVRSAANLTRQILGFARGGKYEVKAIDINKLVTGCAKMFGRTHKEIRTRIQTPTEPMVVEADKQQLEQVLINLLVNARQAMPTGGEIFIETSFYRKEDVNPRLRLQVGKKYCGIKVRDTGVGMDAATLEHIFDPFFTTKEKERGTGLGLASAYGIIKNHAGMITAESKLDQGTTFHIYLPLSDKNAVDEKVVEKSLIKGDETILLVDDEKMIIDVTQVMLTELGYRVIVCENGPRAVAAIAERGAQIDLVILDMIMPGMNGSMVFDLIRDIEPNIPVLLSSGYAINGLAETIMQRGCNGFIQKPYTIAHLSRTIRKLFLETRNACDRKPSPDA